MKTLGNRIEDRLRELGQSQHWLALKVGIKQPSINAIIKGSHSTGSKYLVPIADTLGVQPAWLWDGRTPKIAKPQREAVLIGYIGAGERVFRTEEGTVLEGGLTPPSGYDMALAAKIRGNSMLPLEPGWIVFYEQEHRGTHESHLNRLCAVGLSDGSTFIKKLRKARGRWRLESWNPDTPTIENAEVIWTSPIIEIRTT